MPRLILQPLVENAIVHGIARIEEGGCMLISALVDKDHLRIRIGNPLPPQRAVSGNTHAQGSIEQRLRHHFGAAARVTIVQRADYYECELSLPLTGVASAA